MKTTPEPTADMPEDVASLLDAMRDVPEYPSELRERVFDAVVDTSLGATRDSATTDAPSPGLSGLARGALTFGLGLAVGVALHMWWTSTSPAPLSPDEPAPRPAPTAPETTVAPPVPLEVEAARPEAAVEPAVAEREPTRAPARPRAPTASDLGRELELMEAARAALARQRPADALPVLTEHAREFPSGQLSEEREAMAVQALALSGRQEEARRRAARFRRRFPGSAFEEAVRIALHEPAP